MSLPAPHPSRVIHYSYLWHEEHRRGQEEGRKERPCVVILAKQQAAEEDIIVTVAPITHTPPYGHDTAIEIPLPTKQRLGLDIARSWVVCDEVNRFVWPGPDLRPIPARAGAFTYGDIPPALFQHIKKRIVTLAQAERGKAVSRTQ